MGCKRTTGTGNCKIFIMPRLNSVEGRQQLLESAKSCLEKSCGLHLRVTDSLR